MNPSSEDTIEGSGDDKLNNRASDVLPSSNKAQQQEEQPPQQLLKKCQGGPPQGAVESGDCSVQQELSSMCKEEDCPEQQQQQQQQAVIMGDVTATTTTTIAAAETKPGGEAVVQVVLSKNQLKKKRKYERAMELKRRRKRQEKDVKRAKAEMQGRDLEAERKLDQERRLSGKTSNNKKRRREKWMQQKMPLIQSSFQVCLDCSFESSMTPKEISSLAIQIRYCYANNRKNRHPCELTVTSAGGDTLRHLQNVSGFDEWSNWAFTCTNVPFEEYYKTRLSDVVYLTSDSEHTLKDLDDSKIYIIGGIVDRNRLKRAAINRAEKIGGGDGVMTAKLPINEHLQKMGSTRVLTCNHVFEILLKYREHGRDWKKALLDVLPHRKEAEFLSDERVDDADAAS